MSENYIADWHVLVVGDKGTYPPAWDDVWLYNVDGPPFFGFYDPDGKEFVECNYYTPIEGKLTHWTELRIPNVP